MKHFLLLLLCLLWVACDDGSDSTSADLDQGHADAGISPDASDDDAEWSDVGATDASATDASPPDAEPLDAEPLPPLELAYEEAPIEIPEGARFATVAYGEDPRQVFDLFLPDAEAPVPVVIFFHGGGFIAGSRTTPYGNGGGEILRMLDAQVAWIGADYRLLATDGSEREGLLKSMGDARRVVQFIRHHAEALGLDPDRVGLRGSSAGAGTSLWIGFHPEMANPTSTDLIDRQSTRVQAIAVTSSQSTYNFNRWAPDVLSPTYPLTTADLLSNRTLALTAAIVYGLPFDLVSDPEALLAETMTERLVEYRERVDMLALMSPDDPPFFVHNRAADVAPGEQGFDLLHHPLHAAALAERAEAVEAEATVVAPALGLDHPLRASDFLIEALTR